MAHIRQSQPDSGLGFQVNALKTNVLPCSMAIACGVFLNWVEEGAGVRVYRV